MKKRYSIQAAAKLAGMTSEALRHYDRIGLVPPNEKDAWTGYRYYTERELVRLNTVQALRTMDLPLKDIKKVLEYDNLEKVIVFLRETERLADEKIARLWEAKAKIVRARTEYERRSAEEPRDEAAVPRRFPERAILLSDTLDSPDLENLWHYHDHFYKQVGEANRDKYEFEDAAGIYTRGTQACLFAVCTQYPHGESVTMLPGGMYLCKTCSGKNRAEVLAELEKSAREARGTAPPFTVQMVVVSGILQWNYEIQVPLNQK